MRYRRSGFTLVEILVVLGIIIVLAGLLLPSLNKARKAAARAAVANDLSAIGAALEAYRQDHRDYPRPLGQPVTAPDRFGYDGAILLCQALLAPGDPDDLDPDTTGDTPALGFRTRPGGKMFGPYVEGDRFKLGPPIVQDPPLDDPTRFVILDRFEKPILYFPASAAKPNVTVPGNPAPYVDGGANSDLSRYDLNDNIKALDASSTAALAKMRVMLGDITNGANIDYANPDGVINRTYDQEINAPFILWSTGPDELFGPVTLNERGVKQCDDVITGKQ